ncbi:MAG: hypothetical protein J5663_02100 [Bacteroidaceae bacterium]|nr:hypothetical protein [Bacteroidaceae bacterium]
METEYFMRSLTEEELHSIYGGSIFSSILAWFKRHFFKEKVDEHSFESMSTHGYDGTTMYGFGFDI